MAAPPPRLRPATVADVEAWLDVVEVVAQERRWIGLEPPLDRPALAVRLREAIAAEAELRLVAEAGGEVVGLLSAEEYHGIVSLGMMLLPAWRGHGIGRGLLDELAAWARSRGAHKLTLQVWPHNDAAIRLYERYGFETEGKLRRHWRRASGELWDALVMGLPLDQAGGGQPEASRRRARWASSASSRPP